MARAVRNVERGRGIEARNSLPLLAEDLLQNFGGSRPLTERNLVLGRLTAIIDARACGMCGRCAEICPAGAITVNPIVNIDTEKCLECGRCVSECPQKAITIKRL